MSELYANYKIDKPPVGSDFFYAVYMKQRFLWWSRWVEVARTDRLEVAQQHVDRLKSLPMLYS